MQGKEGKGKFHLGLKLPKVNLGFVKGEEEEEVVRIEAKLIITRPILGFQVILWKRDNY